MNNLKAQCRAKTLWAWSFGLGGLCLAISPLPLRYGLGVKSPWVPVAAQIGAMAAWYLGQDDSVAAAELEELIEADRVWGHDAQLKARYEHYFPNSPQAAATPSEQGLEPVAIPEFDCYELLSEATGIAVLGNSGSGKTTVTKLIAGSVGEVGILVLDPHDDPDNTNWSGLFVIREYPAILAQLEILLELLDARDRTPLVIICDEWPAVRMWCKKQGISIADDFLLRMGSEGRKFNKLPIFCSQSGNTKALGLEGLGDFLENFILMRLQRVAVKYARNLPDRSVIQWLQSTAYGMLIGDEPVIHPTHGHYPRAFKGAPPRGLKPLRSLPLTIPLAIASDAEIEVVDGWEPGTVAAKTWVEQRPFEQTFDQDAFEESDTNDVRPEPLINQGRSTPEPVERQFESIPNSTSMRGVTESNSKVERLKQLENLKKLGCNKEACIYALWQVRKGNSQRYRDAEAMYESMMQELSERS
jgi:hypothetical protein